MTGPQEVVRHGEGEVERQGEVAFGSVSQGQDQGLTLRKAAELLGLSYRQVRRSDARFAQEGGGGLAHRARGKRSYRTCPASFRRKVLDRYRERYADFGPTLAAEYLAKDKLSVSVQTLRRWLIEEGLWQRRRRGVQHRSWRPRKE
ncbi:MAG: helix-turn-helix domain-containing protein [Gemmataceae bacterium]